MQFLNEYSNRDSTGNSNTPDHVQLLSIDENQDALAGNSEAKMNELNQRGTLTDSGHNRNRHTHTRNLNLNVSDSDDDDPEQENDDHSQSSHSQLSEQRQYESQNNNNNNTNQNANAAAQSTAQTDAIEINDDQSDSIDIVETDGTLTRKANQSQSDPSTTFVSTGSPL